MPAREIARARQRTGDGPPSPSPGGRARAIRTVRPMANERARCHHRPVLILIRVATVATAYCVALVGVTVLPGPWAPPWWLSMPAVPVAVAGAVLAQWSIHRQRRSWNRSWLAMADDIRSAAALPRRLRVPASIAGVVLVSSILVSMPMASPFGLVHRGDRYWRNAGSGQVTEISETEYWRSRAATDRIFFGVLGWFCLATAAVQEGRRRRGEGEPDSR
ncbi:hypothetical protein Athai_05770 [Actinocatenispora thailandica]|uniref:Uncharacterized protein n=1 Tax=Actinocatenispora thailandica TaxID=227318 RepID=A0A7R7DJW6_9ACTN|nr:hypothetical protein Athai_05770 [Actinocatenispora thailandica]